VNAGPTSVGVSHKPGDAYRAGLEDTDLLADIKSHDHDAVGHDLHVHTPPSKIHPLLAGVTQTILTKTADQAVFLC
jgi:hypothetical protein